MDWHDDYVHIRTGLWCREQPVFHHMQTRDGRRQEGTIITIPARCGLALDQWCSETGRRWLDSTLVYRGHADKFARPCKRCYP